MGSVPVLKPREVVALLEGHGFIEALLRKIARDIGLTIDEFLGR